jgi:hypothetical protein
VRKKRRHDGPQQTKMLVTNLPQATARQVGDGSRRRWSVELLMKALKGATGWGQHHVTQETPRVERAVAISIMAYGMLLKCRACEIPEKGPWSVFTRKRNCLWQIAQAQIERSVLHRLREGLQERKAA